MTAQPFVAAIVAAIVGDRDRVLDLGERSFARHQPRLPGIAVIAELDPCRREPRFAALVAESSPAEVR